jgi:hypothetical protein
LNAYTDKGEQGYLPFYDRIAESLANLSASVCELGVSQGGSLELWQQLFPHGIIVGVDNRADCHWPDGTSRIIAEQTEPRLYVELLSLSPNGYDLIVDDCSHHDEPTKRSWELLWPLVKPGGFYVIEDWISAADLTGILMIEAAPSFVHLLRAGHKIKAIEYTHNGLIIFQKQFVLPQA